MSMSRARTLTSIIKESIGLIGRSRCWRLSHETSQSDSIKLVSLYVRDFNIITDCKPTTVNLLNTCSLR